MGGFVIGGLLGAAVALMFSRGNRPVNWAALGNAGKMLDDMVNMVRSSFMAPDKRAGTGAPPQAAPNPNPNPNLQQVQAMVNQDPQLKSEVDQIMKENRVSSPES